MTAKAQVKKTKDGLIKGTTTTGFKFEIEEEVLNDAELFDLIVESDMGNVRSLKSLLDKIIGIEQKKKLYDHLRNEKGRVPWERLEIEIKEIMFGTKEIKNS